MFTRFFRFLFCSGGVYLICYMHTWLTGTDADHKTIGDITPPGYMCSRIHPARIVKVVGWVYSPGSVSGFRRIQPSKQSHLKTFKPRSQAPGPVYVWR